MSDVDSSTLRNSEERQGPKDVLIVGAGMYVTGRGTDSFGTIMPVVLENQVRGRVGKIVLVSYSQKGMLEARKKIKELEGHMQVSSNVSYAYLTGEGSNTLEELFESFEAKSTAFVSTPDHTHFEIIKKLLLSDFNVQVVKPFVLETTHALELVHLAKERQLVCSVEFHKRYDEANLLTKAQISDGEIGEILYSVVEYSQKRIIPTEVFRSWCESSSILQYLGVHYCDLIYFITGAIPIRVSCTGQKNALIAEGLDVHDSIQVNIEWSLKGKSFNSVLLTNWIDSNNGTSMSDQKIKFIGTLGRVESDQKDRGLSIVRSTGPEEINPYFSKFYNSANGPRLKGYGPKSIQSFIDATLKCKEADEVTTFKDAVFSTAILEASMLSLTKDGNWVEVPNENIKNILPELYS